MWSILKALIDSVITTNGNNEITGAILNSTLDAIVDSVGDYQFKGIAVTSTEPGTPDGTAWYIANEVGLYVNFGGAVINSGEIGFLKWNGATWNVEKLIITSEGGIKIKYVDLTAEQIYQMPVNSMLTKIVIKGKGGTGNVSIGLSAGENEILSNKVLYVNEIKGYSVTRPYLVATNIYINVSGGTVDVTLLIDNNI